MAEQPIDIVIAIKTDYAQALGMAAHFPKATHKPIPELRQQGVGETTIADLPLKPMTNRAYKVTHMFECIAGCVEPFDVGTLAQAIQNKSYMELPGVLAPREAIPAIYTLDLYIIKNEAGYSDVLKYYYFESKTNTTLTRRLCHEVPLTFNFDGNAVLGPRAMLIMLMKLGGCKCLTIHSPVALVSKS